MTGGQPEIENDKVGHLSKRSAEPGPSVMRETGIVVVKLEAGIDSTTQNPIIVDNENFIATYSFEVAVLF